MAAGVVLSLFILFATIDSYQIVQHSVYDGIQQYVNSHEYIPEEMRSQFKKFWDCILGNDPHRLQMMLSSTLHHGSFDNFFISLNFLIYLHDFQVTNPTTKNLIENVIHESIFENIIKKQSGFTRSMPYNLVKFILTSKLSTPKIEKVLPVPHEVINFEERHLTQSEIGLLIRTMPLPCDKVTEYHYNVMLRCLKNLPAFIASKLNFKTTPRNTLIQLFSLLSGSRIDATFSQSAKFYLGRILEDHYKYTIGDLIGILPKQETSTGKFYYKIIFDYLNGHHIPKNLLSQISIDQYSSIAEYLAILLRITSTYNEVPEEIREASNYFLKLYKYGMVNGVIRHQDIEIITHLGSLVPNIGDDVYFTTLQEFFMGDLPFILFKNTPLGVKEASVNSLIKILQLIRDTSGAPLNLQEAARFYLKYFAAEKVRGLFIMVLPRINEHYFNILTNFMHTRSFRQIFFNAHLELKNLPMNEMMVKILEFLTVSTSGEYHEAAQFYFNYYHSKLLREKYHLDNLLMLLPRDSYFETMHEFFASSEILKVIQNGHITITNDLSALLHQIIRVVLASEVSYKYKQAVLHYSLVVFNEGIPQEFRQKVDYFIQELTASGVHNLQAIHTIGNFLKSEMFFLIYASHTMSFTQLNYRILEKITNELNHLEFASEEVHRACTLIADELHQLYLMEANVVTKIFEAFLELQNGNQNLLTYEMKLQNFLKSEEIHRILRHSHVDISKDGYFLLNELLLIVTEDVNVPMDIREAAYYFVKEVLEPFLGKSQLDIQNLLGLLPRPSGPLTHRYFNILQQYLLKGLTQSVTSRMDLQKSGVDLLCDLLQALIYSERVPMNVRSSARYYWYAMKTPKEVLDIGKLSTRLDKLMLLLPQPKNLQETQYYNLMIFYLKGQLIYNVLGSVSVNLHKCDVDVLRDILILTLNSNRVYMDLKIVARYYLNLIDQGVITDISQVIEVKMTTPKSIVVAATPKVIQPVVPSPVIINTPIEIVHSEIIPATIPEVPLVPSVPKIAESYSQTLTTQQIKILEQLQHELSTIEVTSEAISLQQVIMKYLHNELVIKLLLGSGISLEEITSDLFADFIDIAAHTNDIPTDLRLAAEAYMAWVPKLKTQANSRIYMHLHIVDQFFHSLTKPASSSSLMIYNAIDRYLHSDLPSVILTSSEISLDRAPHALLTDLMMIAEEVQISAESIKVLLEGYTENEVLGKLDQLYMLDKVFQLIEVPSEKESLAYYYSIGTFFRSDNIFEILQTHSIDFGTDLMTCLHSILDLVQSTTTLDSGTIEAAVFFDNLMFTTNTSNELDNLLHLLKRPENSENTEMYNILLEYIRNGSGNDVMKYINLDTHRAPLSLLLSILDLTEHRVNVQREIREAAAYFLKLMHSSLQKTSLRSSYSRTITHSMTRISSFQNSGTISYVKLLNVLPKDLQESSELLAIKDFLGSSLIDQIVSTSDLEQYGPNEEGLLRLILMKSMHMTTVSEEVKISAAKLMKLRYFDYGSLVPLVPQATFEAETIFYNNLIGYLNGYEIYYNVGVVIPETSQLDLLKNILSVLSTSVTIPSEVRTAAGYYLNHSPFFNYGDLVPLLPEPTGENVKKLYVTMTTFLQSVDVNKCTLGISISSFSGNFAELLQQILFAAENCDLLDESVRVAAKYYLSVLHPVSVSVQKVLTKTFDLNQVFSEVFDFSTFTKAQFDAYEVFIKYVQSRMQELLPTFDFFVEGSKGGAFATKFFDALRAQPNIPEEVLSCMVTLETLITHEVSP